MMDDVGDEIWDGGWGTMGDVRYGIWDWGITAEAQRTQSFSIVLLVDSLVWLYSR